MGYTVYCKGRNSLYCTQHSFDGVMYCHYPGCENDYTQRWIHFRRHSDKTKITRLSRNSPPLPPLL